MDNLSVEIVLFPFAHLFNRFYNLLGFLITWLAGSYRYDHILAATGYKQLGAVDEST